MRPQGLRIGIDAHYCDGFSQGVKSIIDNQMDATADLKQKHHFILYHKNAHAINSATKQISSRPLLTNAGEYNYLIGFPYRAVSDNLDVFQSHYILPFWMPCATVVGIYDILYELYPQYFGMLHTLQMRALVRRSAQVADQIITISEFSKSEIVNRYHVDQKKVHVIRCGVSAAFCIQEPAITASSLQQLGINRPYILCVGRKAPIKNLVGMLRAFNQLSLFEKDIDLVIVGPSDPTFIDHSLGADLYKNSSLNEHIRFTGEVTTADLISLYNGARLFVFPSFGEGFGLPVLEAMACGAPVLCSNRTALPEITGNAAVLFDPFKQDEFDEILFSLIRDETRLTAMRTIGPMHASQFTWIDYARQSIDVYQMAANH